MTSIETVRSFPTPAASPQISIDFSPHEEAFSYNVGEDTYSPDDTYYAHVGETLTLTATVDFADDTQSAIGYQWDLGDGTVAYGNPATHVYTLPNEHIQVALVVTDNRGVEWRARKAMYLREA